MGERTADARADKRALFRADEQECVGLTFTFSRLSCCFEKPGTIFTDIIARSRASKTPTTLFSRANSIFCLQFLSALKGAQQQRMISVSNTCLCSIMYLSTRVLKIASAHVKGCLFRSMMQMDAQGEGDRRKI